ncbi:hypothetical protein EDB85DRAFT_1900508 [Lactarius pseudohatsudake]|nr:hypothetical protein EDB85DRAFT_1900508 [Lactarius pseudohatsudake]
MSTSNLSLTQDEQTLHHHAAMLKKELEAYHACMPKDEKKLSVDYYFDANTRSHIPLRIHPLLLSLMEAFKEGGVTVNISSVSENDPRILSNNLYTLARNLPLLNIHSPGQNGVDPLSGTHVCPLTSAASCQECMGSSASETLAAIGSSTTPIPRKRKKDRHVSGSGVRNVLSDKIAKEIVTRSAAKRSAANDFGEAATGTTSKRKGEPLHPEENIDDNWEDEAQPLNKGVRDHGRAIRRGTRLSASPGPATPQLRVQRLTRSQTLAASSRNKQPGSSSSQASTIPTGNSHQNKDVPDNANAIQEILDSASLRVQRLTRSQMLAASSWNEQPGSSSSQASTIPTGNSHQNKVANDVPDDGDTIQEILDSTGLIPYRETNEEAFPCAFTLVCIGSMLTYWQPMAKIKTT